MRLLLSTVLTGALVLAGCAATSTVATRKEERAAAYAALGAEHQSAVDQGQLKVGMSEDAVYIAWGKPAQVLTSADPSGERTTWLYHGQTSDDYLHWRYVPVKRPDGSTYLDRHLDRGLDVREYVSAELVFRGGKLENWRTLPKPPSNTYFGPSGPF
jgi:hypothetical protein